MDQACATVTDLERRADDAEIRLRRLVLVHASTHGAVDLPACPVHMSIAKDAERMTDLALGLCRIAQRVPPPPEPVCSDRNALGDDVVALIDRVPAIVTAGDETAANDLIKAAHGTREACSARLDDVLLTEAGNEVPNAGAADDTSQSSDGAASGVHEARPRHTAGRTGAELPSSRADRGQRRQHRCLGGRVVRPSRSPRRPCVTCSSAGVARARLRLARSARYSSPGSSGCRFALVPSHALTGRRANRIAVMRAVVKMAAP